MKLKIKKEILLEGLNSVSKAMSNKNIIPILSGIKFELKQNKLLLTGSDDDITIQYQIEKNNINKIEKEGKVVIPGKYILDIIKKIPNDLINIETDGLKIIIKTPTAIYNLNGMDADEYPSQNLETTKKPIILNKNIIKNIINQTVFAISNQESRPILTGINIKIQENILEAIATDSYRLSKKIINLDKNIEEQINIVIPGRNLLELIKLIEDNNSNLEIHIFTNKILFKFDNILFQSRLLNGTYPNVDTLIPNNSNIQISTNLKNLYDAIDRASLLSDSDKNKVNLKTNNNEIIIICDSEEVGKIEERIDIKTTITEKIKISFNSRYMLEALKALQSKEVLILLQNESKPIILKNPNNDNLIQLILPIKTY